VSDWGATAEALRARALVYSRPAYDVLADSFPEQRRAALDPSPLKIFFCTRRAAKSFTWALEVLNDARDWPTANYLFLGLVREEAKRIFWKDILKVLDRKYHLDINFNESTLTATLPNGATIYIGAADANEKEMRKLLGQKYRKVAIDEAQDWEHTDVEDLVFSALKPACADMHGSISLLGTPGKFSKSFFRRVTPQSVRHGMAGHRGKDSAGWSLHCWDTSANTSIMADGETMAAHIAYEIDELRREKPGIEETPSFRRNYMGEWVIEDDLLVYRYQPGRNDYSGVLPNIDGVGRWHYVLGIDLGYNDDSAFVLWAFHDSCKTLFGVSAFKQKGMDITAVANRARTYTVEAMVIDGSNKQAVMEMSNRHQLSLTTADKTGKSDFIELMNTDYITGRIKLSPACAPLKDEYAGLIWNEKSVKREEHPACDNHASDGGLYGWRFCYPYMSKEIVFKPEIGSDAWAKAQEKALFLRAQREVLASRPNPDRDFGGEMDNWGDEMELDGRF
jgi:hypothetical protein